MTYQEELDARFEAWQREQTLASLDDCGIMLPMDTSSAAWRRDYKDRFSSSGSGGWNSVKPPHGNFVNGRTVASERLTPKLPDSKSGVGCIAGLVNVVKFYAACALIVGAVYVAVKVVSR